MRKNVIVGTLAAVACTLAGCQNCPKSGVPEANHTSADPYFGVWRTSSGSTINVKDAWGDQFIIERAGDVGAQHYDANAINIDGKTMWEVTVARPSQDGMTVPVFGYWLVEGSGNTITATPMKSEWLEQTVREMGAGTFKSTHEFLAGTGGASVKDPATMEAILKKAVGDKSAFGEPETLTRVNR